MNDMDQRCVAVFDQEGVLFLTVKFPPAKINKWRTLLTFSVENAIF